MHETPTGVSRAPTLGTSAGYKWGTEFPPEFLGLTCEREGWGGGSQPQPPLCIELRDGDKNGVLG